MAEGRQDSPGRGREVSEGLLGSQLALHSKTLPVFAGAVLLCHRTEPCASLCSILAELLWSLRNPVLLPVYLCLC